MNAPSNSEYRIGVICALPKELAAVAAILDEEYPLWEKEGVDDGDKNTYILGRIHWHHVVIACLPAGIIGTNAATAAATSMARTFRNLRLGLMVGIGGGVPNPPKQDIRLGDVVVSQPDGAWPGVVQYDLGKQLANGTFERIGCLNEPPSSLLTALSAIQAQHSRSDSQISMYMQNAIRKYTKLTHKGYTFPGIEKDYLKCICCQSPSQQQTRHCGACVNGQVSRERRLCTDPVLHYGTIASANTLVKDAATRNQLGKEFQAKCVEMEAAGLMNTFPCIVIRGICDYSDAYKNDDWQEYAALAAAAFAKELLLYVVPTKVEEEKPLGEVIGILNKQLKVTNSLLEETKQQHHIQNDRSESEEHRECHRCLKTSTYEKFKNRNPKRAPGTCEWALRDPIFRRWFDSTSNDLLWVSADPGCGKSVLARSLIDHELQSNAAAVCYFFFKDNELQDRLSTALCTILHQLFGVHPSLVKHAIPSWRQNKDRLTREVDDLWRILLTAARDSAGSNIVCVFDALDECREADRSRLIKFLTKFHESTAQEVSKEFTSCKFGYLKFFATSRPYSDIQEDFYLPPHLPSIRLRGEDENEQISREINTVIRIRVQDLATRLNLSIPVRDQLESKLLGMKHRTYLWLHLALDGIRESLRDNLEPDKEPIQFLPTSVDNAYEKILSKVSKHEEKRRYVLKILQIIVGARRPLEIGEMAIALGIAKSDSITTLDEMTLSTDDLRTRIPQLCGLFVYINNSKIFLIHQTAKDFLIRKHGHMVTQDTWKYCCDPDEIEVEMARICVEFLFLLDIGKQDDYPYFQLLTLYSPAVSAQRLAIEGFGNYSAEHWAAHLFEHESSFPKEWLRTKVLKLYDINTPLFKWWSLIARVESRMEPEVLMSDLETEFSFEIAALNGHQSIVDLLVTLYNSKSRCVKEHLQSALIVTSQSGCGTAVASFLLDIGVDINTPGRSGRSALSAASWEGHYHIVKLLLDRGADVNARDSEGNSSLSAASREGYYLIVKLLLDGGADINARDDEGRSPLIVASQNRRHDIVKLLLDGGADVNARDRFGDCALHDASTQAHGYIVKLLLEGGADVNAQDRFGETPLHVSIRGAVMDLNVDIAIDIILLLIDNGADVNAPNQGGETPLHLARAYRRCDLQKLILDRSASYHGVKRKFEDTVAIA